MSSMCRTMNRAIERGEIATFNVRGNGGGGSWKRPRQSSLGVWVPPTPDAPAPNVQFVGGGAGDVGIGALAALSMLARRFTNRRGK